MQLKITVSQYTPIRMARITKTDLTNCCYRWKNWNSAFCCWDCKIVQLLWGTVCLFLKILNIDPLAVPHLGIY